MNRLCVSLQLSILTLYERGWSARRIARELGVHRETVGRELKRSKPANVTTGSESDAEAKPAKVTTGSTPRGRSEYEAWRPLIEQAVVQGLTARRIHQDLQTAHGYTGGYPRHRHQEFLRFLRRIEAEFPPPTCLHLILDNYAIHGHQRVRTWLRKRPRFVLHFTPTSSSWLNLIERWFAELDQKTVKRGVFRSVEELHAAIDEFLTVWNDNPRPYSWTASVDRILTKVDRCRQRLENIQPGCSQPPKTTRSLSPKR
jgi:hypothetical protein